MIILPRNSLLLSLLLVAVLATLGASVAFAADGSVGSFSCSAGKVMGSMYVPGGSCPTKLSTSTFFSFLICNMEQLSSNVMGAMYCGMIKSLTPMVWAAATLAVTLFGVAFMAGITQLSRGAAVLFLIKLAFVTGLALNADFLIGVAYRFLIEAIHQGSAIALSAISTDVKSATDLYKLLDEAGAKAFGMVTEMLKGTLSSDPTKTVARCKDAIFAVLATMCIVSPIIGYLGLALIARVAMAMFSAVFGYIYALIGVTFLIILAPIFLCFYLFKQTQPFFDKWLGYIASFTIQAVLLFAFMSFVLTINVSKQTESITDLIMYKSEAIQGASLRLPWEYCTICEFESVDKDTKQPLRYDAKDFSTKAILQCKTPKKAIAATFAMSPDSAAQLGDLVLIGSGTLLALIALAWLVEHTLQLIPGLAQRLAGGMGAGAAPQLGGGYATYGQAVNMPGSGFINDFQQGFRSGYVGRTQADGLKSNTISSTVQGVKDGLSALATGKVSEIKTDSGTVIRQAGQLRDAPGINQRLTSWLSDPAKF